MVQIVHRTFEQFVDSYAALREQGSKVKLLYFDDVAGKVPALDGLAEQDSLDDIAPQELKALLNIQAQYESKDRLRELFPMLVDFDVIEFGDNFSASKKYE